MSYPILFWLITIHSKKPSSLLYSEESLKAIDPDIQQLCHENQAKLLTQGFSESEIHFEVYLNLRYQGTDTSMMTLCPSDKDYQTVFVREYKREYGFILEGRPIVIDDIRVRAVANCSRINIQTIPQSQISPQPVSYSNCYFENEGRKKTPVYVLAKLGANDKIEGPAIIIDQTNTIVVENDCLAVVTENGNVRIEIGDQTPKKIGTELDSIQLSVFAHRFMSIAEQMGKTLQRTSISTNIKERLDFSCALFGPDGGLVANAPNLPVNLKLQSPEFCNLISFFVGTFRCNGISAFFSSICFTYFV